jgi:hypothetical protein
VLQLRRTATSQIVIVIAPLPMVASNNPARRADTKAIHYPARIRRRLSALTFRLTSRQESGNMEFVEA